MGGIGGLAQPFQDFITARATIIITILILSYLLYRLAIFLVDRFIRFRLPPDLSKPERVAARKKVLTAGTLIKNLLKYIFFFFAAYLVLLEVVGPERRLSLLAGAGVVGIVLGLGAQSLLNDVVSGFFFIFDGQYQVGDFVRLQAGAADVSGVVSEFGLRTTTVRDLDGTYHYLANGSIKKVQRYPHGYETILVDFKVAPETTEAEVRSLFEAIGDEVTGADPMLLHHPKLEAVISLASSKVFRLKFLMTPTTEKRAEELARQYAEGLEGLGLGTPAISLYRVDNEELRSYRSSLPSP